jgi:hypothetical protein
VCVPQYVAVGSLCVQVEFNPGLQSSRYRHFLLPWDNQLLAVGGQVCGCCCC